MIFLNELVDIDILDDLIAEGYISLRFHPELPLGILNYTNKTQFDSFWCEETEICRGLIFNLNTLQIIARPFRKFFNYGQPGAATIDLSAPVIVTDKADGSLGIIYPTPDGYAIATRGSFTSDQAIKATELLKRYDFDPSYDYTYLVEIIYPENRIVLDYGSEEKLVLLAHIKTDSGNIYGAQVAVEYGEWNGPVIQSWNYPHFSDAIETNKPRANAEGIVVRAVCSNSMIKIKQEDYVQLHRLVFGLNERTVWEHLCEYDNVDKLIENLPDEFYGWVEDKAYSLLAAHRRIYTYCLWLMKLAPKGERKNFAMWASKQNEYRPYLFMLYDGKDIDKAIWKSLKPKGNVSMKTQSEDVA